MNLKLATLLGFASLTTACGETGAPQPSREPGVRLAGEPRTRPPVVLSIVVDQLPAWVAHERWPLLPRTGGFARLLEGRSAVLRYRHAHNATALGHSALYTGATPNISGIAANAALLDDGSTKSALWDPKAQRVTATGIDEAVSSSLRALVVPTVADALRAKDPEAFIVSLSMKDRGALFGGGRHPDLVAWFDPATDSFISSTAFTERLPEWARPLATPNAGADFREVPWVPLDDAWLTEHVRSDTDTGQGDFFGLGRRFPHVLANTTSESRAFVATPQSDGMLAAMAKRAMDEAHLHPRRTLIAVSFSATDYIGHVFGPDSPEAWDQLLRFDGLLADLLRHADNRFGIDGYGVVLSSDHGVPPSPETLAREGCVFREDDAFDRRCGSAVRLTETSLAEIAERAADTALGEGRWILGANEPYVTFTGAFIDLAVDRRRQALSAVVAALEATPGILRAVSVDGLKEPCPPLDDESVDALVCRSVVKSASRGDIFLVLQRGSFIDTGYVEGDGVNHGSHWLFDRTVPIVVRAPSNAPRTSKTLDLEKVVDHRAFALAVAALLGVAPPEAARGGALLLP